jgi:O-antigen/teichoic acid export membrane protein
MEYPAAIGIYLRGRTQWFAVIYSVGLVVNVLANYLLVPTYGVFGAAWAWFVAWVTITILMAWLGQCYYPLSYEWKWFLIPIMGWLVLFVGQQWFAFVTNETFWLLRMLLAVIVTFGVIGLIGHDFWLVANKYRLGEGR